MGWFHRETYLTFGDIPALSEVHDGKLYDTRKSVLMAYGIENSYYSIDGNKAWESEFRGVYRTKNNRYFIYHYDTDEFGWKAIHLNPCTRARAMEIFHESPEKLMSFPIPEA